MFKYDFLKKKKIAFIISAVVLIAGLASFIISGFNLGVDFTGGSKITVQLEDKPTDLDELEDIVVSVVGQDKFVSLIRSTSNPKTVIITYKTITSFDSKVIAALAELYGINEDAIGDKENVSNSDEEYAAFTFKSDKEISEEALAERLNPIDPDGDVFKSVSVKDGTVTVNYYSTSYDKKVITKIDESDKYSVLSEDVSTISKNRAAAQTKTALFAAAIAIVLMLVYITFRFKQIASGLSSVVCLFFNLFVMFTFYAIFRWEMTLDIIPACLTILGYSINATIVIFDRIRENNAKNADFDACANEGVHSTLLRSINTTITTLVTVVLVYILGVESIKAFALPLIIGIIAGLFSSVFVSAPLWSVFRKWFKVEERAAAKKAK